MITREQFTTSLRAIADFYDATPEMPLPYLNGEAYVLDIFRFSGKKEFARLARLLGHGRKEEDELFYRFQRDFGGVKLSLTDYRDRICERRVVRTETIPMHTIPAQPEVLVPETVREIVEWVCPESLLDAAEGRNELRS